MPPKLDPFLEGLKEMLQGLDMSGVTGASANQNQGQPSGSEEKGQKNPKQKQKQPKQENPGKKVPPEASGPSGVKGQKKATGPPQPRKKPPPNTPKVNPNKDEGASKYPPQGKLSNEGISADQVQKVIECPVCFEVPRPPIYNCQSGHIICDECRSKLSLCPLCRQGFSDVRNFVAEQLAESCTFKCPFNEQGCVARIKLAEQDQHVEMCNFRPLGCEVYPCSSNIIAYNEYIGHLKTSHFSAVAPPGHFKSIREVPVKKPDRIMQAGYRPPYIVNSYGQTFLQFTQVIGGKMWFWVSLYGTPEAAARYRISLSLVHPNKNLRNTWVGPCHSVRHSGDDIYFNGLCMVMTEECLKAYMCKHSNGNHDAYNMEVFIEKIR